MLSCLQASFAARQAREQLMGSDSSAEQERSRSRQRAGPLTTSQRDLVNRSRLGSDQVQSIHLIGPCMIQMQIV